MGQSRRNRAGYALHTGEYERKNKKGFEYRWREHVGYDADGKKTYIQRSISAPTLKELRELEKKLEKDKSDGIKISAKDTLNDYADWWFANKRGIKDTTKSNYMYMYDKFVRHTRIGRSRVQDLKRSDLTEFYNGLVDSERMSISTCETLQNVIGPALQAAVEDDVIRRNVSTKALRELKKDQDEKKAQEKKTGVHKVQSLTLAEQKRLLEFVHDTVWEPVITIALLTG